MNFCYDGIVLSCKLRTAQLSDFDVTKDSEGKLNKGDVWKYGTTVNPTSRYKGKWLRQMNLLKVRQDKGSASYVLAQEGIKIIKYFFEYGKLPPGNKMFK